MSAPIDADEPQAVRERYARRLPADPRYSLLSPAALMAYQERQRAVLALFARLGWTDLAHRTLIEVGSGAGGNLLDCLTMGFAPENLVGIELLHERHEAARARLPEAVTLLEGDALMHLGGSARPRSSGDAKPGVVDSPGVDIVMQYTVFSSLLADAFQQHLADAMWAAIKPGGGVLWYDFTVDNPRNKDVRGVPVDRVRALFPAARIESRRITLAPPIARTVARAHPSLYTLFNVFPPLRTHLLAWIAKP